MIEGGSSEPVVGYMSHKSNIYLADVHDHMEYALASLDMYAAMAENLLSELTVTRRTMQRHGTNCCVRQVH